jgi:AraC-like ligand binding domain
MTYTRKFKCPCCYASQERQYATKEEVEVAFSIGATITGQSSSSLDGTVWRVTKGDILFGEPEIDLSVHDEVMTEHFQKQIWYWETMP